MNHYYVISKGVDVTPNDKPFTSWYMAMIWGRTRFFNDFKIMVEAPPPPKPACTTIKQYDDYLNAIEKAPDGDDYNALHAIATQQIATLMNLADKLADVCPRIELAVSAVKTLGDMKK